MKPLLFSSFLLRLCLFLFLPPSFFCAKENVGNDQAAKAGKKAKRRALFGKKEREQRANWIRKKEGRKAVVIWELVWKVEQQNVCC